MLNKLPEAGQEVRYLGGEDHESKPHDLTIGKVYTVEDIVQKGSDRECARIDVNGEDWFIFGEEHPHGSDFDKYILALDISTIPVQEDAETAESGGDSMGCANTKLKKGDFVRYLGGVPSDDLGGLTVGKVYEVKGFFDGRVPYTFDDVGGIWHVCEGTGNAHRFVKVFDELSDGEDVGEPVISDYEKKAHTFEDETEDTSEEWITPDTVNSPNHYTQGKFETIEIIEEITQGYSDGFVAHCAGTAIKYIARAPFKHDSPLEDIRKARAYLDFAIARIEGGSE